MWNVLTISSFSINIYISVQYIRNTSLSHRVRGGNDVGERSPHSFVALLILKRTCFAVFHSFNFICMFLMLCLRVCLLDGFRGITSDRASPIRKLYVGLEALEMIIENQPYEAKRGVGGWIQKIIYSFDVTKTNTFKVECMRNEVSWLLLRKRVRYLEGNAVGLWLLTIWHIYAFLGI